MKIQLLRKKLIPEENCSQRSQSFNLEKLRCSARKKLKIRYFERENSKF